MGNTLSGEYHSSWNDDDVKKWQEEARNRQQCTYLQFEGSQFHDLTDLSRELRITKICFAIYGPPTELAEKLEDAYTTEQREFGTKIYDKIIETWKKAPALSFRLGFIFIFCKEGEKEYQVPLFRLLWEIKDNTYYSRYIDTACRVYESSDDWKNNNHMPMMKYCHPKNLVYTCLPGDLIKFDPDENVTVEFNTSPACDLTARIGRVTDVVISTVGMGVGIAALFTPAGFISVPILLSVGGTSAAWGIGRATQRIIDKATHGESLSDLESVLLFLSIAAAPLHLLNGFVAARLTVGAASGRIFSQTQRILATLLMLTAVGIDSFSFLLNLSNFIDKLSQNRLTRLEVLQFSVSTLFFTNMLVQPKTAWGVIERAQQQRIVSVAESMTDAQAKEAFKAYLEENKGNGGIKDTSKIVRNLNKIEDPNFFFKSVKDFQSVKIAGRKGKTVFLTDGAGRTHQANPNNRTAYSKLTPSGFPRVVKPAKLRMCLGEDYEKHRHLGKLNEQQTGRLNKVFGGTADYNKDIVDYAVKLADKMEVKNDPDAFMSLVEVVAAKVKDNANFNFADINAFHTEVVRDLASVRRIAALKSLKFADEYKALYHYRKHGEEFMKFCTPKFYLDNLPANIQRNGKLADVCDVTAIHQDGSTEIFTRKIYFLPDDSMLVLIEKDGVKTISTMYKNAKGYADYAKRLQITNTPPPEVAFNRLAAVTGLDSVQLQLYGNNACHKNFNFCKNDEGIEAYRTMITMLVNDLVGFLDPENSAEQN